MEGIQLAAAIKAKPSTAKTTTTAKKKSSSRSSSPDQVAGKLGGNVQSLESQLMKAYSAAKPDQNLINKLQMQYQAAQRALEGFLQLMRNMHEMLMQAIRRLDVRG